MSGKNGNGNFLNKAAQAAKDAGKAQVITRVAVEYRTDGKIYVLHQGIDHTDPRQAAQIIDMLLSGATAFTRKWVPQFEAKMIQPVEPKIQVIKG